MGHKDHMGHNHMVPQDKGHMGHHMDHNRMEQQDKQELQDKDLQFEADMHRLLQQAAPIFLQLLENRFRKLEMNSERRTCLNQLL